jgi:hypothetical protein
VLVKVRWLVVAAAVLVVLSVGVAVLVVVERDDGGKVVHGEPLSLPSEQIGVHLAARAPVPVLSFMGAQAWTGDELIAVGSKPAANAAVGYNPATGAWRELPEAPFGSYIAGLQSAFVDGQLVVAGVSCPKRVDADESLRCYPGEFTAAVYDTHHNEWTQLSAPTGVKLKPGGSTFGSILGVLGHEAAFQIGDPSQYWAVDPRNHTWRRLPDPPTQTSVCSISGSLVQVTLTPDEMVLTPGVRDQAVRVASLSRDGKAWEPRKTLETTFSTPLRVGYVCSDTQVFLSNQTLDGAWIYDLAGDSWTQQPPIPPDLTPPSSLPTLGWTGKMFVASNSLSSSVAYDASSHSWSHIAPGTCCGGPPFPVWLHGNGLYIGTTTGGRGLITYRPT